MTTSPNDQHTSSSQKLEKVLVFSIGVILLILVEGKVITFTPLTYLVEQSSTIIICGAILISIFYSYKLMPLVGWAYERHKKFILAGCTYHKRTLRDFYSLIIFVGLVDLCIGILDSIVNPSGTAGNIPFFGFMIPVLCPNPGSP